MSDEGQAPGQSGVVEAARVEAYEEDWYRSLKALAERRHDVFQPEEEPEPTSSPVPQEPLEASTEDQPSAEAGGPERDERPGEPGDRLERLPGTAAGEGTSGEIAEVAEGFRAGGPTPPAAAEPASDAASGSPVDQGQATPPDLAASETTSLQGATPGPLDVEAGASIAVEPEPATERPADSGDAPDAIETAVQPVGPDAAQPPGTQEAIGLTRDDGSRDTSEPAVPTAHSSDEAVAPAGPSLLSRDPQERRRALIELSTREPSDTELEQICGLLMDPDREVRLLAVQTLAGFPERVEDDAVRRAIQDPDDEIRAAAVRLAAHREPCDLSLLAPLLAARRHPRTQRTVMELLPPAIESTRPTDEDVAAVARAVGEMDPGPADDERDRLTAIAHALGRDRLTGALTSSDAERLGAVRLLADDASPAVLRDLAALVADPVEEIRGAAQRAAEEVARSIPSTSEVQDAATTPVEPVDVLAVRLADLDPAVRDGAGEELARRDRQEVLTWALEAITAGTTQDAETAALAAGRLGLHEAAPALLDRSTGVPSQERRLLLESLQTIHPDPAALVASLGSIDHARRPQAVDLLWELSGPELLPHVDRLLADASPAVRVAALEGLPETTDQRAVEAAEATLTSDPAPSVRAAAVRALGRCLQGSPGPAMERALADPDPDVRATALQSLPAGEGQDIADLVARALSDPDDRVRRAAMQRFAGSAGGDREVAWAALRGCPPSERGEMAAALQGSDPGLTELAFERLRSIEEDERVLAVEVVGWGGSPGCVEAAIHALGDPSAPVRRAAVTSLGRLRDPSAAAALNKALVDPDPDVRIGAVNALGVIDDESVLGSLVTALKDPEPRVRQAASQVLTEWSSPAVARRLAGVLAVPSLRDSAADLLTRIGPASVELLIDVLRQGNPVLSPIVGGLLSRIVGIEDLLGRFSSPDPERRLRAVEAVGAVGGSPAVDALIRTLFDPDERIRIRTAQLLGGLGDRRAEQAVRQAALEDPVPEVVQAANEALTRLQAQDGGQAA